MKTAHAYRLFILGCLLASALPAHAVEPYQEYRKRVESSESITALTDNLFGDSVSLYDGATEFTATDIDLAGNNALPVQLVRRLSITLNPSSINSGADFDLGGAGNWDVDVPYISGVYASGAPWSADRCSGSSMPASITGFDTFDFWHGNPVHIPGGGDRAMLMVEAQTPVPADGVQHKWTTRDRDMYSCIPMKSGLAGEGFLLQTTSGVRYSFDVAVSRYMGYMSRSLGEGMPTYSISRTKYYLLASKVADRFGNIVNYQYDANGHPTLISSSDGRSIALTYVNGQITSATADGHTWHYTYGTDAEAGFLTAVQLPDGSQWKYAHTGTLSPLAEPSDGNNNSTCNMKPPMIAAGFGITVTHPGGAVGAFEFANERHYRAGVHAGECIAHQVQQDGSWFYQYTLHTPNYFDVMSLQSKTITGLGLQTMRWTYDYGISTQGLWGSGPAVYPCTACASEKVVTVNRPDASVQQYRYGFLYTVNEGRLLGSSVIDASGTTARKQTTQYLADSDASAQAFQPRYGAIFNGDDPSTAEVRPVIAQSTLQDGVTFNMQVDQACNSTFCFDLYGNPTRETRSSTLGYTKSDTTTYFNQTSSWVLGQVASVTCVAPTSCAGQVESQTTYNATNALPSAVSAFGKLQQTLTYNADGTLATVKDGNNHTTTLTAWKRGIPQSIAYPDGTAKSAVVDDAGQIASTTDENGYKTCYGYDVMGRINKITYPSETQLGVCDTSAWAATTIAFTGGNTTTYGVPAGNWRQTILTGNARKILVFDALWRPIVEQTLDLGNVPGTTSEVIDRYDTSGHLIFKSYPMNTGGQANYADTTLKGTHTTYDSLDRVVQVDQDSDSGPLSTKTRYLTGFQTEVTNPRLYKTTTAFSAYDQPIYDYPAKVVLTEGAIVDIARDVYGKPLAVTRHNADNSSWLRRYFAYDGYQQLCKRTEVETGTTFMAYDPAGNLSWSAASLPWSPGTTCAADSAAAYASGRRVDRTYDERNRIKSLVFPDHRGDTTYSYAPDGLPTTLVADNGGTDQVTTTYVYNARRLMTNERLVFGPINWPMAYTYDANGHLASQQWHGLNIGYAPNALGQPTQVGSLATGVSYYPNGAIKQFTYGNGIVHTLTQDMTGRPDRSRDAYGSTAFLDDSYAYDPNGNVAAISDGRTGARGDRDMVYDGLDRLLSTTSPMYGATGTHYAYDALDNLRSVTAPGRDYTYVYDNYNRLTNVTNTVGGASVIGLGYDLQGNLANKNGIVYDFDYGNRLRSVSGSPASTYIYDALGRRVRDTTDTSSYTQYLQNGQLAATSNGHRNVFEEYFYLGNSLIAIRERNATTNVYTIKYQHTDALGSPVAVTDGNRTLLETSEYEPFGQLLNRSLQDDPGYTGHVSDAATGLSYMQQRYYDPDIGRFMSVDPVSANGSTGANFNRYWYAADNPYRFVDPDGRDIAISGSEKDIKRFEAQVYKLTGVHTKDANGRLVQVGQRNVKVGYAGAAQALTGAIKSSDTISIGVVKNDPNVFGDSFANNKFDIGDFKALAGKSVQFGAALLTHVLAERSFDAASGSGLKTAADFAPAHAAGLSAESAVMGAVSRTNTGSLGPGGRVGFDYHDASGNVTSSFSVTQDQNQVLH